MADPSPGRIVLMSVHPEYAEALLNGTKTVELRKARLANSTSHIVIYATAPVQRVVGWVKAGHIEDGTPRTIWQKHKSRVGILEQAFRRYYRGHRRAVAIHVESPQRLAMPLELSAVEDGLTPPQSWRYLSDTAAESVGIRV
ncbi:MAG: ASCH domain-containing protein [Chloroflexi bacterium]|nr:ASCH domain-containing protein [Chloroflexota bacterium]